MAARDLAIDTACLVVAELERIAGRHEGREGVNVEPGAEHRSDSEHLLASPSSAPAAVEEIVRRSRCIL